MLEVQVVSEAHVPRCREDVMLSAFIDRSALADGYSASACLYRSHPVLGLRPQYSGVSFSREGARDAGASPLGIEPAAHRAIGGTLVRELTLVRHLTGWYVLSDKRAAITVVIGPVGISYATGPLHVLGQTSCAGG